MKVFIYDTTLRDGEQAETIFYSKNDKMNIVRLLDTLGVDYIEIGNPVYNPYDAEFFDEVSKMTLYSAKLVPFAGTAHIGQKAEENKALNELVAFSDKENAPCAIFGKAWDLHVTDVLKTTGGENLRIVFDSIRYLKSHGKYVFFDAEHFFDGMKNSPDYALEVIKTAEKAGADEIVLCDTNGGCFPEEIESFTETVKKAVSVRIGIHSHNDCGLSVANVLSAVKSGAETVQGTLVGTGERCGNANLSTIIADLQLKRSYSVLPEKKITLLTSVARSVAQISNLTVSSMPFISHSAFSHKAGMHADAVMKNPATFEHIDPSLVGNKRNVLLSEISGKSAILPVIRRVAPELEKDSAKVEDLLAVMKKKEAFGYHFEAAQASFELLIRKELGIYKPHFSTLMYKIIDEATVDEPSKSYAFIEVDVAGDREIAAAYSDGPVHALDCALRKALASFFPSLSKFQLIDYKVRVMNRSATGSTVSVLIDSTDGRDVWSTVGVSVDIIRASQEALIDSIEYKLLKDEINGREG